MRAVREATLTTPIIMAGAGDPVGTRLIQSLARPAGNITGLSLIGEELVTKGLSLLKEAVPRLRRVGVLMNATNPANDFFYGKLRAGARVSGIEIRRGDVHGADQLEAVIGALGVDGVFVLADPMFRVHRHRIADGLLRRRMPLGGADPALTRAGGLLSYSPDFVAIWGRSADYVVRILRGAVPGELPVEQPTKFELVINLKTAKALGLTIPPSLLQRADQVIE